MMPRHESKEDASKESIFDFKSVAHGALQKPESQEQKLENEIIQRAI